MGIVGMKDTPDSGVADGLKKTVKMLTNMRLKDAQAKLAVIEMNAKANFWPGHPLSHLSVENGRVELGTRMKGYFKILRLPTRRLVGIYTRRDD